MNFRTKLTLFMIVLLNLTIVTEGLLNNYESGRIIEETAKASAVDMVKAEIHTISGLIKYEMDLPKYLANDPKIIDFFYDQQSKEKSETVTKLLDGYFTSRDNLEGIILVDAKGINIATTSYHASMLGIDLSKRDYHIRTLANGKNSISETLMSLRTGSQFFAITHPVIDENSSEILGYIATLVLSESMAGYMKGMKLSGIESSYAFLIDEKGNYIYNPQTERIGRPVETKEIMEVLSNREKSGILGAGTIEYWKDNQRMMAAYSFVPETGWSLAIEGSMSEARAPVTRMNTFIVIISIILTAVATVLVFYGTKFISQPIIEELKVKNYDLTMLNEEVIASEEELRQQNEKLIEGQDILEEKNRMLEVIMEASDDGIWYINLNTGESLLSNKWVQEIIGPEEMRVLPHVNWEEFIHPQDREAAHKKYMDFREGRLPELEDIYRILDITGDYRWLRVKGKTFYDKNGQPQMLAGVQTDIDNLKKQEEKLDFLAYHDVLTGLPNRFILIDRLDVAIKTTKRQGGRTAVMFIDIDNFKRINDSMGHSYGDELLKQIGNRIKDQVRESDTLVRFGGDEFVIICQGVAVPDGIADLSERVKVCFKAPFKVESNQLYLSCSIGVSVYPDDGNSSEELLKHADTAMYKAKANGKNNVQFFNKSMKDELESRIEIERDIREAIDNDEFVLYYQPQYDMKTGRLRGLEALIRWNRPGKGMVSPGEFIPVAEETGLIVPIGNWVLHHACTKAHSWYSENGYNGIICINISAFQLKQPGFVDWIKYALKETGLEPSSLELEITESIFIESFDAATEKLEQLKILGVRISLDDFGTGYSSLAYLKTLPIHTLKIDRSFINEIRPNSSEKKMLGSIISLVQNMDMEIVAEGVETREQFQYLLNCGCDNIQGYLTSRPVPEEDVPEIIHKDIDGTGFNGAVI